MSADEADAQRAEMLGVWERAAPGWGERADEQRAFGMPVSAWMIDHLELHPGEELLELAAGPGDTGFMAAELIQPGGTLICSDAAEAMIECGMHVWDVAAPLVLIEEAGGRVTDVTGARRIDAPSFVGSNGHLHDELLRRLTSGA